MSQYEPRFRSLPRAARRERIIGAAKVPGDVGEGAGRNRSMEDVAARAGTTKPTVYAHFQIEGRAVCGGGRVHQEEVPRQASEPGRLRRRSDRSGIAFLWPVRGVGPLAGRHRISAGHARRGFLGLRQLLGRSTKPCLAGPVGRWRPTCEPTSLFAPLSPTPNSSLPGSDRQHGDSSPLWCRRVECGTYRMIRWLEHGSI